MKVVIFTEGGSNIGLGHLSRCSSLYDEVINRGMESLLVVYGDLGRVGILKGYNVVSLDWHCEEVIAELLSKDDYCIVDSYLASQKILEAISKRAKGTIFIDDTNRLNYPKGIVVNPSIGGDLIDYPKRNDVKYLLGKDYIILRTPFLNSLRIGIKKRAEEIFVVMGGTDVLNIVPVIVDGICSKYKDILFRVVVGKDLRLEEEGWIDSIDNVVFYSNLGGEEIKNLMLKSDLAISAAGQTINELIATKTPFIPLVVADNQLRQALYLEEYINIKYINPMTNSKFSEDIDSMIEYYLSFENRLSTYNRLANLVDFRGSERIINGLFED